MKNLFVKTLCFYCPIALNWGFIFLFVFIMPLLYSGYTKELAKEVTAYYLYFQILYIWSYPHKKYYYKMKKFSREVQLMASNFSKILSKGETKNASYSM